MSKSEYLQRPQLPPARALSYAASHMDTARREHLTCARHSTFISPTLRGCQVYSRVLAPPTRTVTEELRGLVHRLPRGVSSASIPITICQFIIPPSLSDLTPSSQAQLLGELQVLL